MPTYGYIRTSRHLQEGPLGMAPASQELQLRRAGVPLENIFHDVGVSGSTGTQQRQGWHQLNDRLAGGDTLVVVVIDRIGRRWPDTIRSICELRNRGVKIRSLAETEAQWTHYLETDEGSPEAFFGQVLTMFAALGGRPGAGVHQAAHQGGAGSGPEAGQDPGPAPETQSWAAGSGPEDAGVGRQPTADCRCLRVLARHRLEVSGRR
jgi:DNA invertase Pin-like site-specific DNA recombinase